MVLDKSFYTQDTVSVAKALLGKVLVHYSAQGITAGRIVETEAYLGTKDPASHGYRGVSNRTLAMFGDPGHAYIYFTYGMYYCFNVTTAPKGIGEGVLIRALEPIEGIDIMINRRHLRRQVSLEVSKQNLFNVEKPHNLCNGPAKLVIAMGITKDLYGSDLTKKPLVIEEPEIKTDFEIVTTTRIGISQAKDLPLRFYIKDNKFISKK